MTERAGSAGQRRAAAPASVEASPTRAALLVAARACVRRHGIAGTTSRLIAGEAGANLAAITYYFGSKDALVAEALFGDLAHRLAPVLDLLEGDAPAATRLIEAVRVLVSEFDRSADDVPVFLEALMLCTGEGDLADQGRELIADLRQRLTLVIGRLVADGMVAPWVDPPAMASLLIATANGIVLQSQLQPRDDHLVATLTAQFANLLLAAAVPTPVPGPT